MAGQDRWIDTPVLINNAADGRACFKSQRLALSDRGGLVISERQGAHTFRHRISAPDYASDWHFAGDPTLILIRSGALAIELVGGESRTFKPGDCFIAADRPPYAGANPAAFGHRARVTSADELIALHVKLTDFVVED